MDVGAVTRRYILYFFLPLWIVPSLLDLWCQRRTRTAGSGKGLASSRGSRGLMGSVALLGQRIPAG